MTAGQKAYREFLKTPFWKSLSAEKKRLVGKCEQCGSTRHLQSHHKRYPADWFDTTLDDLEVLCRMHHVIEHFGDAALSPHGRPWDEEWFLDLTSRFCSRIYSGKVLKRSQRKLLINMARKYRHDVCLKHRARVVFRLNHIQILHPS